MIVPFMSRTSARQELIDRYSPTRSCACCGEQAIELLTVDHEGGDGSKERRRYNVGKIQSLYRHLRDRGWPTGYRILCMNCNWAIGVHGYCPHQEHPVLFTLLDKKARPPFRHYAGDCGYDLFISRPGSVPAGGFADLHTDVAVAFPGSLWGRITGRSSTWRNWGLYVVEGCLDSGYRGELFIGAFNPKPEPVTVKVGDRLAQLIPHRLINWPWQQVESLPPSDRGEAGFGSTGR